MRHLKAQRVGKAVTNDLRAHGQAVFVDDQWRNIEGAVRCGLQTVHFDVRDPAASYDKALQLLGV